MADLNVYPVSVQYFGEMWKIINGRGQVDVISGGGTGGTQYTEGDVDSSITGTAILWEDAGDTLRTVSAVTPLPVNIISGGGGGTQYAEGTAFAGGDLVTGAGHLNKDGRYAHAYIYAENDTVNPLLGGTAIMWRRTDTSMTPVDELSAPLPCVLDGVHDSEVWAKKMGVWDIDSIVNITGTVSLPTGAATESTLNSVLGATNASAASLSVLDDWDESDRAKVNPIVGQAGVQGNTGVVTATTQRVTLATNVELPAGTQNIGDVDIASLPNEGQQTMANSISVAIASNQSAVPVDTELAAAAALADGVANPTIPTVGAYNLAKDQGAATTYSRITSELANSNTTGSTADRGQHTVDITKYSRTTLTALNVAYDTSTTETNSSASIDCSRFRSFLFLWTVTRTSTPTDIQVKAEFSNDGGSTWFQYRNNFWGQLLYDDTAIPTSGVAFSRCYSGDCVGDFLRFTIVATGTSGSLIFTVTNATCILKN